MKLFSRFLHLSTLSDSNNFMTVDPGVFSPYDDAKLGQNPATRIILYSTCN